LTYGLIATALGSLPTLIARPGLLVVAGIGVTASAP
jgi:hypothetical protein